MIPASMLLGPVLLMEGLARRKQLQMAAGPAPSLVLILQVQGVVHPTNAQNLMIPASMLLGPVLLMEGLARRKQLQMAAVPAPSLVFLLQAQGVVHPTNAQNLMVTASILLGP